MRMKRFLCGSLLGAFIVAGVGCMDTEYEAAFLKQVPVPEDAYDVQRRDLGQAAAHQLLFRVQRAFPSSDVVLKIDDYLQKKGWHSCSDAGKWTSYEDRSSAEPVLVHSMARYWIAPANDAYLLANIRYYSDIGLKSNAEPDNDIQTVVVWMTEDGSPKAELERLGISCSVN